MPGAKRIAIVGASVRAAACSAASAGFEVLAADLFADADLRRVCPSASRIDRYPEGFEGWLATVDCDGWLYTGALENHPELIERMAALRPLWGVPADSLRMVRDPWRLAAAGLPVPETRQEADGLPLDGSWLAKTGRGASGVGVWRLDSPASLRRANDAGAYFQRRVAGRSAAAAYVTGDGGARLLGVTRQSVGAPAAGRPFAYAGSIGPIPALAKQHENDLRAIGHALHSAFGLRGLVGVDLVLGGGRAWVVEVNPRYTASMEVIELATGESLVGLHAGAFGEPCGGGLGGLSPAARGGEIVAGKRVVFARREIQWTDALHAWALGLGGEAWAADIPTPGTTIPAGAPLLSVLAVGDANGVTRQLRSTLHQLRVRLAAP